MHDNCCCEQSQARGIADENASAQKCVLGRCISLLLRNVWANNADKNHVSVAIKLELIRAQQNKPPHYARLKVAEIGIVITMTRCTREP